MRKQLTLIAILAIAVLTPSQSFAQSNVGAKPAPSVEQQHFYHLDFVVKEVEAGRAINSRSYSMIITTHGRASIRTGTKVPFNTSTAPNNAQYTQIDVGVNIDCYQAQEIAGQLALNVKADISSLADPSDGSHSGVPPVIRRNTWDSGVIVPIKQPTTIFSSDDLGSKRKMQLELIATRIE